MMIIFIFFMNHETKKSIIIRNELVALENKPTQQLHSEQTSHEIASNKHQARFSAHCSASVCLLAQQSAQMN